MKKSIVKFLCTIGICTICTGCSKLQSQLKTHNTEVTETQVQVPVEEVKYNPEDGLICILFGEDFTIESFYDDAVRQLSDKYGLEENGGIILPVKYPDGLKSRISNLYDIITEHKIRGIILLGAPDGTHKTLNRLRTKPNEEDPAPYTNAVFSFMPQDDIMGQESTCDFILEYEITSSDTNVESEISITPQLAETVETILIRAVRYIEENPESLMKKDDGEEKVNQETEEREARELRDHVQTIVGAKKVRRYTDPETGLQARNHFVIEQ